MLIAGCGTSQLPESYFVDLEHRWVAALQSHDIAVLDSLLDDSFIDTTFRGGVRTKHDILSGPSVALRYHSLRLDSLLVRRYGNESAVVTGINVLQGPAPGDLVRIRFTDLFVNRGGTWRAVSAQETLQSPQ